MARVRAFKEAEVLDKALELFWLKGYHATSASDLVSELGLSRSSIYSTFKDKRTLFIKTLERYSQLTIEEVLEAIRQSDDIPETITTILKEVIVHDYSLKIPRGCFMVNTGIELAVHDEEIKMIVNQHMEKVESTIKTAIVKGQVLGQITPDKNADILAKFICNNISGLKVAVKSNKKMEELMEIINLCISVLKAS